MTGRMQLHGIGSPVPTLRPRHPVPWQCGQFFFGSLRMIPRSFAIIWKMIIGSTFLSASKSTSRVSFFSSTLISSVGCVTSSASVICVFIDLVLREKHDAELDLVFADLLEEHAAVTVDLYVVVALRNEREDRGVVLRLELLSSWRF